MGLSGAALRTAIGLTAGLCFLSFGFGQGDIGGLMLVRSFRDQFPRIDAVSYPTLDVVNLAGITVSSWNLGCFVGAVSAPTQVAKLLEVDLSVSDGDDIRR